MNILLLHPGQMGASIGAALVGNGHDTVWVAAGRSAATTQRAERAGLRKVDALADALDEAQLVVSVCPPDAALDVARQVRAGGFAGLYVDGNAVAPATAMRVAELFGERFVDGGIIGPPAWRTGATRFYFSGERADQIAALFADSLVDARVCAGGAGAASALKMCYAAYTKGTSALLLGVRALAERSGVAADLIDEWRISQPALPERSEATAASTSPKAWRFAGEMREIAATFAAADLPSGFHEGAAAIFQRMAALKDHPNANIGDVLQAILGGLGSLGGEERDTRTGAAS